MYACVPSIGVQRRFRRGAYVVVAGLSATALYLVERGVVRVIVPDQTPGRETTAALLGPGQIVGESALVGAPVYHASAVAETDAVVWSLPIAELWPALLEDAGLATALLVALGYRLGLTRAVLADSLLLPVSARIPNVQRRLAACDGADPHQLSRKLLATLIGASRETVSRIANARVAAC